MADPQAHPGHPPRPEPADILLGITTCNRMDLVMLAARSLAHAVDVDKAGILVIDDNSSDYGLEALRPLFPPQAVLQRHPVHSGRADFAAHALMRAFVEQRREAVLVILDSDLLVAQDVLARLQAALPRTDGLLSLFNAQSHPGVLRDGLLVKPTVGFAGTVWTRELVAEMLQHVQPTPRFDWDICTRMQNTGRKIFCLPDSAVQHIGIAAGQNSQFLRSDYGLGFRDTAWYNLAAIQEVTLFGTRAEIARMQQEMVRALAETRAELAALRAELEALRPVKRPRRKRD
jgi:hypothetical protein